MVAGESVEPDPSGVPEDYYWDPAQEGVDEEHALFLSEDFECATITDGDAMVQGATEEVSLSVPMERATPLAQVSTQPQDITVETQATIPGVMRYTGCPHATSEDPSLFFETDVVENAQDTCLGLLTTPSQVVDIGATVDAAVTNAEGTTLLACSPTLPNASNNTSLPLNGSMNQAASCEDSNLLVTPSAAARVPTVTAPTLCTDLQFLKTQSNKFLQEQCLLRNLARGGNKTTLLCRLEKALQAPPVSTTPPNVPSRVSSALPVSQPSSQTSQPSSQNASQSSTIRTSRAPPNNLEAPWVDLTVEQAKNARYSRHEFSGAPEGGPSAKACGLVDPETSSPKDYFELFFPEESRSAWVTNSRKYAVKCGAGTDMYPNYKPFSLGETDRFLGLLVRNGLAPIPDLKFHFVKPEGSFVFGDHRVQGLFERGYARIKEFKALFHVQDPYAPQPPDTPMWKVEPVLAALRKNSQDMWDTGPHVSLDEQDVGFQGRSEFKEKIKFKKEGDGILCDALCERGYTWTFHFRHVPCPQSRAEASALHNRCLYLIKQLRFKWTTIACDNLFISRRFLQWALLDHQTYVFGVARAYARGVPTSVVQLEVSTKAALAAAVGTVKVARTEDFKLFAVSVYDSKPVHMLSTAHSCVELVDKVRQVWDPAQGKKVDLEFQRLNVIDDYNFRMNGVDVADQLRLVYRLDGPWMRMRKWWWAIFLWAIGVAIVNAYLIYTRQCSVKKLVPMTHLEFCERLAQDLCYPSGPAQVNKSARRSSFPSEASSTGKTKYAARLTKGLLTKWTSRFIGKHPISEITSDKDCQLCKLKAAEFSEERSSKRHKVGEKVSKGVQQGRIRAKLCCIACGVNLCGASCWNEFHGL
ncbi:hypothetical protein CYMTET_6168 [Cymbomonas tetramitiformis]|uniref:PiggyBac transposable element-derived protein domain-containing protein n=1 Tax=Cymbomonas tetramitiformis TaxID=36881 RepID=A0AAE0GZK5_9CHLO|nr:hypothetical protein CYMTET_6168 [Cymbomonas tetramitiformis]